MPAGRHSHAHDTCDTDTRTSAGRAARRSSCDAPSGSPCCHSAHTCHHPARSPAPELSAIPDSSRTGPAAADSCAHSGPGDARRRSGTRRLGGTPCCTSGTTASTRRCHHRHATVWLNHAISDGFFSRRSGAGVCVSASKKAGVLGGSRAGSSNWWVVGVVLAPRGGAAGRGLLPLDELLVGSLEDAGRCFAGQLAGSIELGGEGLEEVCATRRADEFLGCAGGGAPRLVRARSGRIRRGCGRRPRPPSRHRGRGRRRRCAWRRSSRRCAMRLVGRAPSGRCWSGVRTRLAAGRGSAVR